MADTNYVAEAQKMDACPACEKAAELAKAEWDAGGSPASLPLRCPHAPDEPNPVTLERAKRYAFDVASACGCCWAFSLHGYVCPEHGIIGKVVA